MKIYLAGNLDDGHTAIDKSRERTVVQRGVRRRSEPINRLVSFAYEQFTPKCRAIKSEFIAAVEYAIDSGAFSAWSRGTTIDLEAYAKHVLAHRDLFTTFVASLDVIPGSKNGGLNVTPAERERAAEEGWENWIELKRFLEPFGITPIHTYHRGEDRKWLKKLIDESEYLSLGGTSILPTREKMRWLNEVWPDLTDDKGWPIRKVHGFACTAVQIVESFPWYSVDSASWLHSSEHGDCYIKAPRGGHAVVNFYFDSWNRCPTRHFSQFSESDQKDIAAYLATCGFTPGQLSEAYCECGCGVNFSHLNRDAVNADFFWGIEEEKTRDPRPWRRPVGVLRLDRSRPTAGGFDFG